MESNPQILRLERRANREREARKSAEKLLNQKSRELYDALQAAFTARRLMEMALWAGEESVWIWSSETAGAEVTFFEPETGKENTFFYKEGLFFKRVHPDEREEALLQWKTHLAGASNHLDFSVRIKLRRKWRWIRVRGRALENDDDGHARKVTGTVKDITDYRQAETSFRLMASAFSNSRDAMLILTQRLEVIEANQAFYQLSGLRTDPDSPLLLDDYLSHREGALSGLVALETSKTECRLNGVDGKPIPVELSINPFHSTEGDVSYLIAILRDISERKKSEAKLRYMATTDLLTGLPNKSTLQTTLANLVKTIGPTSSFSVIFIDLDGFKAVNDSLGHGAGDELLCHLSRSLEAVLGSNDTLYRWGGDEFVVLSKRSRGEITPLCEHILTALCQPAFITGQRVSVSGSIGIAMAPEDGAAADNLLRNADAAMYSAKAAGKNRIRRFHANHHQDALKKVTLLSELRAALEEAGLEFHLQPKFNVNGKVCGAEILARWFSALHGQISPAVFVPLAEQNGLAASVDKLAINAAIEAVTVLKDHGYNLSVAANVSPLSLVDPNFPAMVLQECENRGVPPELIEIEVTESLFLNDTDLVVNQLEKFSSAGIRVCMDDFGTGYSSLSYLQLFPFDLIKIDRAFLLDAEQRPKSLKLLQGIIQLCKALEAPIVAEGIEQQSQLDLLRGLGVEQYQGFYLARPMSLEATVEFLRAER